MKRDISGKITLSVVVAVMVLVILNIGVVLADRLLVATNLPKDQAEQLQSDPSFFVSLGNVMLKSGNPGAAIKLYGMALDLDSKNEPALLNMAIVYNEQKSYDLAIIQLEKLIVINPNNPVYHYDLAINLADSVRDSGSSGPDAISNLDRAISEFQKADELSPGFMKSQENIIALNNVKAAILGLSP